MKLFVTKQKYRSKFNPLQVIAATLSIHSMLFLFLLADVMTWAYQAVYFSIMQIPKIPRHKFIQMNRHKTPGLSIIQRWSCWYCEYVNGVISWMKEVANQTELYSCAIKYEHKFPGQEYQEEFYSPDELARKLDSIMD
jgi:hypothetical protein